MNEEKTPGLGELLRAPGEMMGFAEGKACSWRFALFLAAATAAGCALFGFAVGSFVDLKVAALDTAKMVVVALQAVTLVRPMLAPLGSAREPAGKCFFLVHFAKSFSGGNGQTR